MPVKQQARSGALQLTEKCKKCNKKTKKKCSHQRTCVMRWCSSTTGSSTISSCPKKQRTTEEGGEVCPSFCHGAKSPPGLSPSQWDWGSFEPRRLRRARVKPPARFTGVSPRMWGICTAEPRCCQRAPRRPLTAPARERMVFLEGLNFFRPAPLWILLRPRTWMFLYSGGSLLAFPHFGSACAELFDTVKCKIMQGSIQMLKEEKHRIE